MGPATSCCLPINRLLRKKTKLGYGRVTGTVMRWFRKPARIVRHAGKPPAVVLSQSAFLVEASSVQLMVEGARQ